MVSNNCFIELNSENATEFTIRHIDSDYRFVYFGEMGYCQVLYDGMTMLVMKYSKSIRNQNFQGNIPSFDEEVS